MSVFGERLRNWVKVNWESEDEQVKKILDDEFEKAVQSWTSKTPEGVIRFGLFDYYTINRKLTWRLRKFHKTTVFIDNAISYKMNGPQYVQERLGANFPPYDNEAYLNSLLNQEYKDARYMLLFHINTDNPTIESIKEVIQYWFETYVLISFEESLKNEKNNQFKQQKYSTFYDYWAFVRLAKNLKLDISKEEYEKMLSELCNKHGLIFEYANLSCFRIAIEL